ncbi:MAG: hypothetical protein MI863_03150 [Desulfobacterales bacterium]|nr:hypothetical protein [Desulfobacterales bacterium]
MSALKDFLKMFEDLEKSITDPLILKKFPSLKTALEKAHAEVCKGKPAHPTAETNYSEHERQVPPISPGSEDDPPDLKLDDPQTVTKHIFEGVKYIMGEVINLNKRVPDQLSDIEQKLNYLTQAGAHCQPDMTKTERQEDQTTIAQLNQKITRLEQELKEAQKPKSGLIGIPGRVRR